MAAGTINASLALFQRLYRDVLRPAGLLRPDPHAEDQRRTDLAGDGRGGPGGGDRRAGERRPDDRGRRCSWWRWPASTCSSASALAASCTSISSGCDRRVVMLERALVLVALAAGVRCCPALARLWRAWRVRRLRSARPLTGWAPAAGRPSSPSRRRTAPIVASGRPWRWRDYGAVGDRATVRTLSASTIRRSSASLGIDAPATVVVDAEGRVRHLNLGMRRTDAVRPASLTCSELPIVEAVGHFNPPSPRPAVHRSVGVRIAAPAPGRRRRRRGRWRVRHGRALGRRRPGRARQELLDARLRPRRRRCRPDRRRRCRRRRRTPMSSPKTPQCVRPAPRSKTLARGCCRCRWPGSRPMDRRPD